MSDDRVRLAIVGCGMAALIQYVPAVRYLERGLVTALCDPDPRALDFVGRYLPDAQRYQSYDELLAAHVSDAVLILTPTALHSDQVARAARAGYHVFCEKPMAPSLAECDHMIEACGEHEVILMCGFMKRFDKSLRHVKKAIDDGSMGEIYSLVCDWRGVPDPQAALRTQSEAQVIERAESWRGERGNGGGLYADLGAHTTDLARWWLGDISAVSGELSMIRPHSFYEDNAVGTYLHQSGARSTHLIGITQEHWHESYQLDGADATLDIRFGPGASHASTQPFRITRSRDAGAKISDETLYPDWSMDVELERSGRYTLEVGHFCECIQEARVPLVTAEDARKATEAVVAVYLSAYLGEKIRLPLEGSPDLDEIFNEMRTRRARVTQTA